MLTKPVVTNQDKALFVPVDRTLDNVRLFHKVDRRAANIPISQYLSVEKKSKVDKEPKPYKSTTVDKVDITKTATDPSPPPRPRALNSTWKALVSALNLRKPNMEPDHADCTVEDLEETTESIPSLKKPSGKNIASTSITDQYARKKSSDNQSQMKPLVNNKECANRAFRPSIGNMNPSINSSQKKAYQVDHPVTGMGSVTATECKKDRLRWSSLSDKENHAASMKGNTTKHVVSLYKRERAKRLSMGSVLDQRQDHQNRIQSRQRARVEADRNIVKARLEHYQKQGKESRQKNHGSQHQASGKGNATKPGRLTSLHQTTNKGTVGERLPESRSTAAANQQLSSKQTRSSTVTSNKRQRGQA